MVSQTKRVQDEIVKSSLHLALYLHEVGKTYKSSISTFTTILFQKHCSKRDNFFINPFSVNLMAMMSLPFVTSAIGNKVLTDLLNLKDEFDDHPFAIHEAFKWIQRSLQSSIRIDNRIFVAQSQPELENVELLKYYDASLIKRDFDKTEDVQKEINQWVEDNSGLKLELTPRLLGEHLVVLANAIYFEGVLAEYYFKPEDTFKEDFTIGVDDVITVDMMHAKNATLRYTKNEILKCETLEIPYANDRLCLFLILPEEKFGLSSLETKLTVQVLSSMIADGCSRTVNVSMPPLSLTPKAFSNMTELLNETFRDTSMIMLSANMHKVIFKQTTTVIHTQEADVSFIINHPFIFFVRDKYTGIILLWGRMINPKAE